MIKLPDKKYVPKHNRELKDYAKGWNTIIENAKCLGIKLCYLLAMKEDALESIKEEGEKPFYHKGCYDCIVEIEKLNEIERLNEEVESEHRKAFDDMFKESNEALDKLKVERTNK